MTMERRNSIERILDRANLIGDVIAIGMLVVIAVVLINQANHLDNVASLLHAESEQIGNQHRQLVEGCRRLQILRVNENISHAADYQVFQFVLLESRVAERAGRIPAAQRPSEAKFLVEMQNAVDSKTWTPLTDCASAVNLQGVHYRSPAPVRFEDRPAPRSALTYPPGSFN